jgi:hypothetical protein
MSTVEIDSRVWARWEELQDDDPEASISLLFVPRPSLAGAADVLARVVRDVEDQITEGYEASGDSEGRSGSCWVTSVPEGVLLRVGEEPRDFERLLRGIASALEERSVAGRFELYQPRLLELPEEIPLLECRLRVNGYRDDTHRRKFWRPDQEALEAATHLAVA